MEKRKLQILIDREISIFCEGWKDDCVLIDDKSDTVDRFARIHIKDGKIVHLWDWQTYHFGDAKGVKMFDEICEFTHGKHTFTGSFIEALEYIKREF